MMLRLHVLIFAPLAFAQSDNGISEVNFIRASGDLKKEIRTNLTDFTTIQQNSDIDIYVEYNSDPRVDIIAHENFLPHVQTTVRNKVLIVSLRAKTEFVCFPRKCPLRVIVRSKMISHVENNSTGHVYFRDPFYPDFFVGRTTNRGSLLAKVHAAAVQARIDGRGSIVLEGSARQALFEINGSGAINAFNMRVRKARVMNNGTGNANVWVMEDLEATLLDSGNVMYHGKPNLDRQTYGFGAVREYYLNE